MIQNEFDTARDAADGDRYDYTDGVDDTVDEDVSKDVCGD